jgi:hypothetical protein
MGFGDVVCIELAKDPVQWESFGYSRVESKCSKMLCIFLFLAWALKSVCDFFLSLSNICSRVKHALHRFKVLKAVTTKSMVFLVIGMCSSETAQCFGGIYFFHFQGLKRSQERNQEKQAASWASAVSYFTYTLWPWWWSNMFLWNTELSLNYTGLQPWKLYSSSSLYF